MATHDLPPNSEGLKVNRDKYLEFHCDLYDSGIEIEKKATQLITEQIGDTFLVFFVIIQKKRRHMGCVRLLGTEQLNNDIRFTIDRSFMEDVVKTGNIVILPSVRLVEELQAKIQSAIKDLPETFLCVPYFPLKATHAPMLCCIMDLCDKCACSVISVEPQLLNQLKPHQQQIVSVVLEVFRYCGCTIALSMLYDEQKFESEQSDALLDVAENLFHALDNVSGVLRLVMNEARKLARAERCSLFLVDRVNNLLVAKVFEDDKISDVELPLNRGIVGKVAKTGEMMNVRDAYSHPLFFKDIDDITGFRTRSILCVPIHTDGEVIAVAELCNKESGSGEHFSIFDEEIAHSFASYCGISIKHTILYQKATVAKARQKLTNELMMYHFRQQVSQKEVATVLNCTKDHRNCYMYNEYRYSARDIDEDHTPCVIFEMFKSLRILKSFQIPERTFIRCVLYFKKGYRDMPYHNWSHAMAVVHFGYCLIRNLRLLELGYIELLDAFAFLLACIGHDIDHRGTTNAYQNHAQTALASLYSSEGSVMEHHHFNQTVIILSLDDCNILEKLDKDQYTKLMDWLRYLILSTDLANHLDRHDSMRKKIQRFQKNKLSHKRVLMSLLISCSDLSCVVKDWCTARRLAESVYEEFFQEGELATRLGYSAGSLMNRSTAHIPEQQIGFVQRVCLPLFRTVRIIFPQVDELVTILKDNVAIWNVSKTFFYARLEKGQDSLDILANPDFEAEVVAAARAKGLGRRPVPQERASLRPPHIHNVDSKITTESNVKYTTNDTITEETRDDWFDGPDMMKGPSSLSKSEETKADSKSYDSKPKKTIKYNQVKRQSKIPSKTSDSKRQPSKTSVSKAFQSTHSLVKSNKSSRSNTTGSRSSSVTSFRSRTASMVSWRNPKSSVQKDKQDSSSDEGRSSEIRFKNRRHNNV